ncbi:unnamed protein product [Rhizoctonia solani]|uniref:F-box domain-containing protein n=1 Tax=Rhizoctonia solani TaxID=456999 RepID=A0A8H3HR47_9AGAM|nr:unnamed protein product [Rhizoctonia solani]CAE6531955.1 unnamed protein product [Rhizoctonia solani]
MSLLTGHRSRAGRLPTEILSMIFINCGHEWNVGSYEPKRLFGCQLTLPAVCHFWRRVALDLTALWTCVKIANDPPYDLLELFLSRSGVSPLDISVYMGKSIEDVDDETVSQSTARDIYCFLRRHCSPSRWKSFRLEINHIYSFSILATWPFTNKSTFPSLQSLDLNFTGSFPLGDHGTSLEEFLYNMRLEFSEPQAQLRFLKIRGLLSPHIFGTSFHRQLPGLVNLELHFSGKEDEWYTHRSDMPAARLLSPGPNAVQALDTPKVHMPTLKTLSFLSISSPVWVLNHLLTLDAPNMTTFKLTLGEEPEEWFNGGRRAIRHLISYIATSGPVGTKRTPRPLFPSLTHITFSNSERFQEDMEMFLAGYPKIDSLALPECPTLQPMVKSALGLANLKVGIKEVTELKDFLLARREAGVPLRTVQVARSRLGGPIDASVLNELEELVQFSLVDELEED